MSSFQPPPTWALPILVDEKTQKAIFNPIWLKWFVELSANLSSGGKPVGAVYSSGGVTTGHLMKWADTAGTLAGDGGVLGSAAHAATSDFLGAADTAANSSQLETKTWEVPGTIGSTTPNTIKGTTIQATSAAGFKSSDGSTGYTGTVTTASLVGKTITIKDGIITSFA